MQNKIDVQRTYDKLKIFINDTAHLHLTITSFVGIQSWIEGKKKFVIEYYFKDSEPVLTEYQDKESWSEILKKIDELM